MTNQPDHTEDCECRECIPHDTDCPCIDCYEMRYIETNRKYGDYLWNQEQRAAAIADDLTGGELSKEEEQ